MTISIWNPSNINKINFTWLKLYLEAAAMPILHNDFSQQEVQAYNFVLSPITIHPGSQILVQFLSNAHNFGGDVELAVLVV